VHRVTLCALGGLLAACASSTPPDGPAAPAAATTADIAAADLRTRLYVYSDDSMQGRRSGTPGGIKATDYIAAEAERLGLEPAGDGGTYFQNLPMLNRTIDPKAAITIEGTTFRVGEDLIARDQGTGARPIDGAQAVYGGVLDEDGEGSLIPAEQAAGKVVVITVAPEPDGTPAGPVNRARTTERFRGAAGIVVATLDQMGHSERLDLQEVGAQLGGGHTSSPAAPAAPTFLYASGRLAEAMLGAPPASLQPGTAGRTVRGGVPFLDSPPPVPARNVVAILRGSDPALRGQFIAIGAHNDHDGIAPEAVDHDSLRAFNRLMRPEGASSTPGVPTAEQAARIRSILDSLRKQRPPRRDSVLNGADDDGSGTVGVLEIAESLARGPEKPRRSIVFVWHAAEELSLLGSEYFTDHPTVPRDSIVAQLNIDMIGRGGPDDLPGGGPQYLQLIGSRRLSTELGDIVEQVNRDGKHGFVFDYTYDRDGHPENIYCRSDHANYARYGIPVTFFTTGGHLDYHQLTDEAQYIDFDKLTRVTRFVADVAMRVADLDHRVVVDKAKPDPGAPCRQ
jgi:hypothetical protein